MARQKVERYADALGIVKPTVSQFVALINDCIFSERDRYIMTRYLIDDIPALIIADEVQEKFPHAPIEELAVRRVIRKGINQISRYV